MESRRDDLPIESGGFTVGLCMNLVPSINDSRSWFFRYWFSAIEETWSERRDKPWRFWAVQFFSPPSSSSSVEKGRKFQTTSTFFFWRQQIWLLMSFFLAYKFSISLLHINQVWVRRDSDFCVPFCHSFLALLGCILCLNKYCPCICHLILILFVICFYWCWIQLLVKKQQNREGVYKKEIILMCFGLSVCSSKRD